LRGLRPRDSENSGPAARIERGFPGHFLNAKSAQLGGDFHFRFSALYIAREKGGGASMEVMVGAWVGIVRRGDFRVFRKMKKSECAR
jgi:hypothetical protein